MENDKDTKMRQTQVKIKKLTRCLVLPLGTVGRTANQGHVIFLKLFSSDLVIPVFVGKDASDSREGRRSRPVPPADPI